MERFGIQEIEAVTKVIKSGALSRFFQDFYGGSYVQEFERAFATYLGVRHAISTSNGTAALEVALKALRVRHGDEIITTPLSFAATSTAILNSGAKPVFVDIDPQTLNINAEKVREAITEKTRGIVPVSLLGFPAAMPQICETAREKDLFVLEDTCQALGASIGGRKIGTFGTASSFSFQESKTITSLDWHEPILLLSPFNEFQILHIGDFVENYSWTGWRCVAFDENLKVKFASITGVHRHPVDEDLYELILENGRKTTVTHSHSVFIIEDGSVMSKPVSELKGGDFCCVPLKIPHLSEISEINLLNAFLELPSNETSNLFYRGQKLHRKGCWKTRKPSYHMNDLRGGPPIIPSADAEIGNKSFKIKAILKVTPELCRLLGYYLAEGNWSGHGATLSFGHSEKEKRLARDAKSCIASLGFSATIYYDSTKTSVHFGQKYLKLVFKKVFETGTNAHNKQIPSFLFRVSYRLKTEFIEAYFAGDGYLQKRSGSRINSFVCTVSNKMAEQLPYLLLSMDLLPSVEYRPARQCIFDINGKKKYVSKCSPSYNIGVRGIAQVNKLHRRNFQDFASKPQLVECIPTNHARLRHRVRNYSMARKNGFRTVYEKERITRKTLAKMRTILPDDPWLTKLQESEIGFAKLKTIRKVESTSNYVYDLCVDGYENFVGGIGGICLHNTLGEGGMIVTDNDDLAERCYNIRNHGNIYGTLTDTVCTNARMTEAAAAFGKVQLDKLEMWLDLQHENAELFLSQLPEALINVYSNVYLSCYQPGFRQTYLLIPVYAPSIEVRDRIVVAMKQNGISTGLPGRHVGYYKNLIYDLPMFKKYARPCPKAEYARDHIVLFDIHRWQTSYLCTKTIEALKQILKGGKDGTK